MLTVALIGSGAMARIHAERIASIDGVDITAVASPNNADSFAATHVSNVDTYIDLESLLADQSVDVVDVCTPTHTHRELVETAAANGCDVLCEKPIARTLSEAAAIRSAVADTDITFMVGHTIRFFQEYVRAKRLVDEGAIGEPGIVRARRGVSFGGERGWKGDERKSGGVLLDLAIHDLDYLRWVVGDVERVFTRISRWGDGDENHASTTTLRFEDGTVGHVESSWMRLPSMPFTAAFELSGDDGLIEFDTGDIQPTEILDTDGAHVPTDPVGHDVPLREDGYYRQLAHFFECVRGNAEPAVSVQDAIEALRLSLAAIESAETGRPIAVAEVGS